MKTRIKKQVPYTIANRDEAELAMNTLAQTVNALRQLQTDRDAAVLAINERVAPALGQCEAAIALHTAALEAWATANPDAFQKDRKSLDLTSGKLGFRTGNKTVKLLSRKFTWEKVLCLVRTYLPGFIRTKEEVHKEALIAAYSAKDSLLTEFQLRQAGLQITQDETFYVAPDLTKFQTRQTT